MKSARLSGIFSSAAQLIREHGHHKGFFVNQALQLSANKPQPLCAVGALRFAQFGNWLLADLETEEAQDYLCQLLEAEYPEWCAQWRGRSGLPYSTYPDVPDVLNWNDDPDTTPQQVIDLLELAAAKCRPDAYTEAGA